MKISKDCRKYCKNDGRQQEDVKELINYGKMNYLAQNVNIKILVEMI